MGEDGSSVARKGGVPTAVWLWGAGYNDICRNWSSALADNTGKMWGSGGVLNRACTTEAPILCCDADGPAGRPILEP